MSNGTFASVQYGADGELVEDAGPTKVQTKEDWEAAGGKSQGAGSTVNAQSHSLKLNITTDAEKAQLAAQERIDGDEVANRFETMVDELDRLRSVASAGQSVGASTLTRLNGELNDLYIQLGSQYPQEMGKLRNMLDAVSAEARRNR